MLLAIVLALALALAAWAVWVLYPLLLPHRTVPKGFRRLRKEHRVTDKRASELRDAFSAKKIPEDVDFVVVGSGVSGLVTGAILARVGRKVVVLEQHYLAGGCLHCFEEKGYEFDTGLHYMGRISKYGGLLSIAADRDIKFARQGTKENGWVYDKIILDGEAPFDMKAGSKQFWEDVRTRFKDSPEDVERLRNAMKSSPKDGIPFLLRMIPQWAVRPVLAALRHFELLGDAAKSTSEVLDSLTTNNKLKGVMLGNSGDEGGSPDESSWLIRKGIIRHYVAEGGFYPVGGPQEITRALIAQIEKAGGRVLVRANVERILIERGRATGVVVKKAGDSIRVMARDGVVSSVGAKILYEKLLPTPVAKPSLKQISMLKSSAQHISVFVGINKPKSELNLPSSNYWVIPNMDLKTGKYFSPMQDNAPEYDPFSGPLMAFMGFPSAKDPEWEKRHPNKSVCCIITEAPYAYFESWAAQRSGRRDKAYKELKEKIGRRLVDSVLLKYHPELNDSIDFVEVGTPLTSEFYLGSDGSSYGLSSSFDRFYDPKSIATLRADTGIGGLWLSGQDIVTAGIAGGITAGYFTASAILGYGLVETMSKRGLVDDLKKICSVNKFKNDPRIKLV